MTTVLETALEHLKSGKTILYPTDTIWGIGCDATNSAAVSRIYAIKERKESKSLILLVSSFQMLEQYVTEVPQVVKEALAAAMVPTTVVYKNPVGIPVSLLAADGSIAIRVVQDSFCEQLIEQLSKPLVSTSANRSGATSPKSFSEIDTTILESVDYVVNLPSEKKNVPASRILRVNSEGKIVVIRA